MATIYFTSITANYFAKARVLCSTLKEYNRDAKFILVISDTIPEFIDITNEQFDYVIETKKCEEIDDIEIFYFKHNVTELCTAIKPFMALKIIKEYHADKVIYLDPDIAVFEDLSILEGYLENNSIVLTPHQLQPEDIDLYVRENEILFLKRGTFNLGFFGVKADGQGYNFLNWWNTRLMTYCYDDNADSLSEFFDASLTGLFTDQKWIDLVPSYFDNYYIIREPGYNACTWNLTHREIHQLSNGKFTVNNKPLYFYHFSGYDSGAHHNEIEKHLGYYKDNKDIRKLSRWYEKQLKNADQDLFECLNYERNYYSNGEKIQDFERKILHMRKDIYLLFRDPFIVDDGLCYYSWVRKEYKKWFKYFEGRNIKSYKKDQKKIIIDFILPLRSKRRILVKKIYKYILKM